MKSKKYHFSLRSIALVLALVLVMGMAFVVPSSAADTGSLGKLVDYFQANSSTLTLNGNSRFFLSAEPTGELLQTIQLAQRQFAADGIPTSTPMDIVWGDTKMLRAGDIYIEIVSGDADIGTEGYKIVATDRASVTAEDVNGLLYGLNQLQKHFRAAKSNSIKGFTTYDTPDTKERTVQLDCARKYLTVEYVCNFIKEMSWMGYNTLQLHVSEDGGFRADFWDPNYYVSGKFMPENDFTWLCGSQVQSWVKDETANGGKNYRNDPDAGKYLSTAELIQIIDTCKEYHIDIIPSFDSPGHMDYLTWKFEQHYNAYPTYTFKYTDSTGTTTTYRAADTYGCINYAGKTGGATPLWPQYTSMDIRDTTTRGKMSQAFVFSIYEDMAEFFSYYAGSTKFNIGTDEVNLTNSAVSSTAWSYSLFPGYVNELNALLKARGYTVRMFNDFMEDDNLDEFDSDIEILYWNSPYNSITGKAGAYSEPAVSSFVNDGRILYNCINQHTYYVLRVGVGNTTDARSATCHNWEFYGATEDTIYNYWTPNNIRKKGVYTEPDAIVPDAQLGGAYFLTWHDYAAVNTETEMWNGVKDFVANTGETYSVRDRMWSNTIKMWNWDINTTSNSEGQVTFSTFKTIRDLLGDFPGLDTNPTTGTYSHASYAKATSLPAATAPIQLADHTELTAAVASKISKGSYSDETYAAYEAAFNKAVLTNNNNKATAEELGQALSDLNAAIKALAIKTNSVTVVRKTTINGVTYTIDSTKYSVPIGQTKYNLYIPALTGYNFLKVDGATFTPTENGDGSGYLTGAISSDITVVMQYENAVDVSRLNTLIADAITEQGNYTSASWRVYENALNAAREFSLEVTTQQATVTALVEALEAARTALVVNSETTYILVEKLTGIYNEGQQVGLYVHSSSNIPSLNITNKATGAIITPNSITGEVQTLTTGETVKYWLVFLPAEEAGIYTYTFTFGETSTDISVTVV